MSTRYLCLTQFRLVQDGVYMSGKAYNYALHTALRFLVLPPSCGLFLIPLTVQGRSTSPSSFYTSLL